jgi:hypothetical protein
LLFFIYITTSVIKMEWDDSGEEEVEAIDAEDM